MLCDEDCRTAGFGKTERPVGWEGNGETSCGANEALQWGNLAATDRLLLPMPSHSFTLEYCELYADLFPEVRSFEAFKYLHIGMISDLKRKTLPAIAKAVGLANEQGLHNLLTEPPWSVSRLRQRRLNLLLELTQRQAMILLIDETGDCKKGNRIDYVKRQYIVNVGKRENGIVVVTAYGLFKGMILPLCFEVYKPRERLKPGEVYQTIPQIASTMIRELIAMGFQFDLGVSR